MSRDGLSSAAQAAILSEWRRQALPVHDELLAEIARWFGYSALIEVDQNDIADILRPCGEKHLYTTGWEASDFPADIANKLLAEIVHSEASTNQLIFLCLEPSRIQDLAGRLSGLTVPLRKMAGSGSRALWLAVCPDGERPVARLLTVENREARPDCSEAVSGGTATSHSHVADEDLPRPFRRARSEQ